MHDSTNFVSVSVSVSPAPARGCLQLNDDLADISSIMKKNIQEVLNRGEKLDRE